MLQDRLNKIKDYFQSIEQFDGKWVICVKYKPKWGAYPSENGKINAVPDENTPDLWWYYGKDNKVDIDSIFDLIDETIQTNLDAIRKVELFKLKAEELKKIFSDDSISFKKLQTLKFIFDEKSAVSNDKPKKSKRSKPMSKKDILKIDDSVVDEATEAEPVKDEPQTQVTEAVDDGIRCVDTTSNENEVERTETVVNATELSQEEIDDLRG